MNNYLAKVKLSNYINSRVIDVVNDDGEMEKGIFIPIDINGLFHTPRNQVISWLFINEKLSETGDGFSHYIKMKTDSKHLEKLNALGYTTPYIGVMRSCTFFTKYHDTYSKMQSTKVKNIEDDE